MAESRHYLTFLLDGHLIGVEVEQVQALLGDQEMTRVPLAPRAVRGLFNLRGQVVAAIDLRLCLELKERPVGERPRNLVVRTDDGPMSLMVDEIGDVVEVEESSTELPCLSLEEPARALVRGAYQLADQLLLVLDTEKVIQQSAR